MDKKLLFISLALFLIITISGVSAIQKVEITSPKTASTYNVGDSVPIVGQITLDRDLPGATVTFTAYSKKYNITIPLSKKYYNFQKDVPAAFSQINLAPLMWNLAASTQVSSDWKIIIKVEKSPTFMTTFESGFFSATKSLPITVSVNSYIFNLGETLDVTGTVLTARENPVEGTANVLLEHIEESTVFSGTVEVKDGFLSFHYPFNKNDPSGVYTITFRITDQEGNVGFTSITGITLTNDLKLNCSISGKEFLPGDSVSITGNLQSIHNTPLSRIPIVATVNPPTKPLTLYFESETNGNGNFGIDFQLPKLGEPGEYSLRVIANDTESNVGLCTKTFFVNAERKLIVDLNMNSTWYFDGDEPRTEVRIQNRGNVDLQGKVALLLDGVETASNDFYVIKGLQTIVSPYWVVPNKLGEHKMEAVLTINNQILFQTEPQFFTIFKRPPPKIIKPPAVWQIFILLGLIAIAILAYVKKKDIRDYMWHRELKRKYGIGERMELPAFKKKHREK